MKKVKLLALIFAVLTGTLLFVFLSSLRKPADVKTSDVIIAAMDIPSNIPITAEMITQKKMPAESAVSGSLSDSSLVIGKVSEEKIFTGEQILNQNLIKAGDSGNGTLAYELEPGMRAVSIEVSETTSLAYMIVPGNHVDILAYFLKTNGTEKESYLTMVLENIKVLAVGSTMLESEKSSSDTTYTSITLQVTPKQAMELSMAESEGKIKAALRSPLDDKPENLPSITLNNVMVK